jgi:Domain of unknown function (DUF4160)
VPEISRFFGIVITMYFSDHPPPHFHARYGKERALVEIDSLTVLAGSLPPRVFGLVTEWGVQHRRELRENWERAERREPPAPITPLE